MNGSRELYLRTHSLDILHHNDLLSNNNLQCAPTMTNLVKSSLGAMQMLLFHLICCSTQLQKKSSTDECLSESVSKYTRNSRPHSEDKKKVAFDVANTKPNIVMLFGTAARFQITLLT